jgi:hypothetical protein
VTGTPTIHIKSTHVEYNKKYVLNKEKAVMPKHSQDSTLSQPYPVSSGSHYNKRTCIICHRTQQPLSQRWLLTSLPFWGSAIHFSELMVILASCVADISNTAQTSSFSQVQWFILLLTVQLLSVLPLIYIIKQQHVLTFFLSFIHSSSSSSSGCSYLYYLNTKLNTVIWLF